MQGPQLVLQMIYLETLGGWDEADVVAQFSIGLSAVCLVLTFFDVFGTTLWVCCCRGKESSGSYAI